MGWFKKKTEEEKLIEQYDRLVKEAHRLSHTDRKASDAKQGEAEEVWKKVEALRQQQQS
jgi:hypothetical protein